VTAMYLVRVRDSFCAAHMLTFHNGSVEPLHGHNWRVELAVACPQLDATGIGIDFEIVKRTLHDLLDSELDHRNLNHLAALTQPNPTSEHIARWIAGQMTAHIHAAVPGAHLHSVTVWETDDCGVTYEPDRHG